LEGVIQTNAPDPAANGNATYAPTNLKASQDYGHQTSLFTQSATEREGKRIQLLSHRSADYGHESQMISSSGSNPAPSNVPGQPSAPRMDAAFSQAQLATVIPTQHPLNRDTSEPVLPVGARGVHTNNNPINQYQLQTLIRDTSEPIPPVGVRGGQNTSRLNLENLNPALSNGSQNSHHYINNQTPSELHLSPSVSDDEYVDASPDRPSKSSNQSVEPLTGIMFALQAVATTMQELVQSQMDQKNSLAQLVLTQKHQAHAIAEINSKLTNLQTTAENLQAESEINTAASKLIVDASKLTLETVTTRFHSLEQSVAYDSSRLRNDVADINVLCGNLSSNGKTHSDGLSEQLWNIQENLSGSMSDIEHLFSTMAIAMENIVHISHSSSRTSSKPETVSGLSEGNKRARSNDGPYLSPSSPATHSTSSGSSNLHPVDSSLKSLQNLYPRNSNSVPISVSSSSQPSTTTSPRNSIQRNSESHSAQAQPVQPIQKMSQTAGTMDVHQLQMAISDVVEGQPSVGTLRSRLRRHDQDIDSIPLARRLLLFFHFMSEEWRSSHFTPLMIREASPFIDLDGTTFNRRMMADVEIFVGNASVSRNKADPDILDVAFRSYIFQQKPSSRVAQATLRDLWGFPGDHITAHDPELLEYRDSSFYNLHPERISKDSVLYFLQEEPLLPDSLFPRNSPRCSETNEIITAQNLQRISSRLNRNWNAYLI